MLGKIMLAIVVVCSLSIGVYTFTQKDEVVSSGSHNNAFMQIEQGKRGDDPLYAEEIKKNTALTLQARDKAERLAEQLEQMKKDKAQSEKRTEQALTKIDELMTQLQTMRSANAHTDDSANQALQAQVDEKIATLSQSIEALSSNVQSLADESDAKIQALESSLSQTEQTTDVTQQTNMVTPTPKTSSKKTFVYGSDGLSTSQSVPHNKMLQTMADTLHNAGAYITQGLDRTATDNRTSTQYNEVPTLQAMTKKEWQTVFPVYTLPPNTVLAHSTLITPIIGRVPLANNKGSEVVADPFFFKVEIGADNLAANGHRIAGVSKMIASGYATGVREQSCVRGYIDSLTFVFVDGRIVTHGEQSQNGTGNNEALGYLADTWGKPCIRGRYINNAKDYLMSRGLASFVEAAANGLSQSQMSSRIGADGSQQAILSGDVWKYVLGAGVGGSASEVAQYVRDRSTNAFDVVYVEQAKPVQIWLNTMIPIDYDAKARKVQYYAEPSNNPNYD